MNIFILDEWVMCDDENVNPVTTQEILKLSGGGIHISSIVLLAVFSSFCSCELFGSGVRLDCYQHGRCRYMSNVTEWNLFKQEGNYS